MYRNLKDSKSQHKGERHVHWTSDGRKPHRAQRWHTVVIASVDLPVFVNQSSKLVAAQTGAAADMPTASTS